MAFHRRRREAEHARSFLDGQTAEVAQFHDVPLLAIELGEFIQGIVERDQVCTRCPVRQALIQRDSIAPVALGSLSATCRLDQDLPHQRGADSQEMLAVLELVGTLLCEAQVGLVHQCRALKGVIRAFPAQVITRQVSKLVIDKRKGSAQRRFITGLPVCQQPTEGV